MVCRTELRDATWPLKAASNERPRAEILYQMASKPASAESQIASMARPSQARQGPILIVPYMWIGDFVRCHTVVKLLKARFPARPVDGPWPTLCAPLADYMPELRQAIGAALPRKRLSFSQHQALAA